jgi:hypothetical protein
MRRRGLETRRVAECTAYRVIAGGTARPKTSVQDARDSESKPKPSFAYVEETAKGQRPGEIERKIIMWVEWRWGCWSATVVDGCPVEQGCRRLRSVLGLRCVCVCVCVLCKSRRNLCGPRRARAGVEISGQAGRRDALGSVCREESPCEPAGNAQLEANRAF